MIRKEKEIKVIYVLVLALFAVFLAIPLVRLLAQSFFGDTGAGIGNYAEVLTGRGIYDSPWKQPGSVCLQRPDSHGTCFFSGVQYTVYKSEQKI